MVSESNSVNVLSLILSVCRCQAGHFVWRGNSVIQCWKGGRVRSLCNGLFQFQRSHPCESYYFIFLLLVWFFYGFFLNRSNLFALCFSLFFSIHFSHWNACLCLSNLVQGISSISSISVTIISERSLPFFYVMNSNLHGIRLQLLYSPFDHFDFPSAFVSSNFASDFDE